MNPTEKLELQVTETDDGGASVVLPDGEAPEVESQPQEVHSEAPEQVEDEDLPSQEAKNDKSEMTDEEREAIRAERREERRLRKQITREKAKENHYLIETLRRQNAEMAERLSIIEKKTSGAELARVDKAIEDAAVQVEYAKMKMRDAVANADGDGVAKAEEMLYEARRKMESLQNVKVQATKQTAQPKQNINIPDPTVQRLAADWMERNPWYDPNGKNEESEIAQVIDKKLTQEGYDPSSEDYWDELDDRLKKYLPNKVSTGYAATRQRPKNVMTSSGRETAATTKANEFRLSPDRVQALKEAGAWDNPELRLRMIRRFAEFDRQNKNRS